MSQTQSAKLDIKFSSFTFFDKTSFKENESLRISITSIPDNSKKSMIVPISLLDNVNQIISLNVSNLTKKVIVVFRKLSDSKSGHIVASTIIHKEDLPGKSFINSQLGFCDFSQDSLQTLDIFEPNHNRSNKEPNFRSESTDSLSSTERRIIGSMKYQVSLSSSILTGKLDSGDKIQLPFTNDEHSNFSLSSKFSPFQKKVKDSHTYSKLYA